MKIIGKAEQKKIELQIESLQNKVTDLEKQLLASQSIQQKQELAAKQAQSDAVKAQAASDQVLADTKTRLEAKTKDLASAQAAASKAKQECDVALLAANKALADAKALLETKAKELAVAQAAATKAKQDSDAAKVSANKALADAQAQLDAKVKDLEAAKAAAAKAKQEGDAAKVAANKALDDAKAESAKATATAQAKFEVHAQELSSLKAERDKKSKLLQQLEAKYQDSAQENELLLLQLMQAQEESDGHFEQKEEFEKLYLAYKARWERLEKRLPNYLDVGSIEILDVDGVSDIPVITWLVKDFAQAGVALSEFSFVTVMQDGHPGIGLIKNGKQQAFVPKLLSTNKDHLAIFLDFGTTEFKQLTAVVGILDQLEAGQWADYQFPEQFDLNFWRPSIKTLIAQIKKLPILLRYDEVRLKRELINPDYEHLWLEFRGLSLGAAQWTKFEIRLGAALVQADGFSQYPKFEIPLVDGKTKPFDSWYAESQDDSGAKVELRFALEKNVFDTSVLANLADSDKALLLRLIYAFPDALKRLEKQKTAIHRSWATWIDFASGAVKVLEANKAVPKLPASASVETGVSATPNSVKALPAPADKEKLPVPARLTSTGAKASKIISITSKPIAKSNIATGKTVAKATRKTKK